MLVRYGSIKALDISPGSLSERHCNRSSIIRKDTCRISRAIGKFEGGDNTRKDFISITVLELRQGELFGWRVCGQVILPLNSDWGLRIGAHIVLHKIFLNPWN